MSKDDFAYLILATFGIETKFDAHAALAAIGPRLIHRNKGEGKLRQAQRG